MCVYSARTWPEHCHYRCITSNSKWCWAISSSFVLCLSIVLNDVLLFWLHYGAVTWVLRSLKPPKTWVLESLFRLTAKKSFNVHITGPLWGESSRVPSQRASDTGSPDVIMILFKMAGRHLPICFITWNLNSLLPGRFKWNFQWVIFKLIQVIDS